MTAFITWLSHLLGWDTDIEPLTPNMMPIPAPKQPQDTSSTLPESEHPNALKLVLAAKQCLGKDLSAGTGVPPYVACALSVNRVHSLAFGVPIGGGSSTLDMYKALLKHPGFKEVPEAEAGPGTVVICPTGYGTKPQFPHGHVGILCSYGICANDSATGLWSETYADLAAWKLQFETIEGYQTYYFQRV